jgi:hypothetical protein
MENYAVKHALSEAQKEGLKVRFRCGNRARGAAQNVPASILLRCSARTRVPDEMSVRV